MKLSEKENYLQRGVSHEDFEEFDGTSRYRHYHRHYRRIGLAGCWQRDESGRRDIYQYDQDGHRTDHLPYYRPWHRQHG
ncbi:hypothetical protein D1872_171890 [compost metagenome]